MKQRRPFIETDEIIKEFNDILKKAIENERIQFIQRKAKAKILGQEFKEVFELYDLEGENVYDSNDESEEFNEEIEFKNRVKEKNRSKSKIGVNKYIELEAEHSGSQSDEENSLDDLFSDLMEDKEIIEDSEGDTFIPNDVEKEANRIKEIRRKILERQKQRKESNKILIESSSSSDNTEGDDDIELNTRNSNEVILESESDSI